MINSEFIRGQDMKKSADALLSGSVFSTTFCLLTKNIVFYSAKRINMVGFKN